MTYDLENLEKYYGKDYYSQDYYDVYIKTVKELINKRKDFKTIQMTLLNINAHSSLCKDISTEE